MPLKMIILMEFKLRTHVDTWLFYSQSVSQCSVLILLFTYSSIFVWEFDHVKS